MPRRRRSSRATPALLTGTSSEFLGRRPWPRVLRERQVVVLLGPQGVGKTVVAEQIAGVDAVRLDTTALSDALLRRVREGGWGACLEPAALILDGPVWLRGRPGVVELLRELVDLRRREGRRTVLCQRDCDGSIDELIAVLKPGTHVVIGLRFPKGPRGRMRFARALCDVLGAPREAARGTDQLDPWRYDRVVEVVRRWPDPPQFERPGLVR